MKLKPREKKNQENKGGEVKKIETVQTLQFDSSQVLLKMIENYLQVRDKRRMLDQTSKEMKIVEEKLEQDLWDTMEAHGFKSIKTDLYGNVIRTFRNNPFVTNFSQFRTWARENEEMELIQESAKRQKLRDYINEKLKDGSLSAIPPGIDWVTDKVIQVKGRERGEEDGEI